MSQNVQTNQQSQDSQSSEKKLTRAERRRKDREEDLVAIHRGNGFTFVSKLDLNQN